MPRYFYHDRVTGELLGWTDRLITPIPKSVLCKTADGVLVKGSSYWQVTVVERALRAQQAHRRLQLVS